MESYCWVQLKSGMDTVERERWRGGRCGEASFGVFWLVAVACSRLQSHYHFTNWATIIYQFLYHSPDKAEITSGAVPVSVEAAWLLSPFMLLVLFNSLE
jgi:hypothetical protein